VLPSMRMVECLRVVQQSSQEKMAEKSLPRWRGHAQDVRSRIMEYKAA
jgi:hypothetical protein